MNNEIQPKATKAMDMRFYWLKDREARNQFRIYWRQGKLNKGDYVTKHHPAIHHQTIRSTFLTPWKVVEDLRAKLKKFWPQILKQCKALRRGCVRYILLACKMYHLDTFELWMTNGHSSHTSLDSPSQATHKIAELINVLSNALCLAFSYPFNQQTRQKHQ